MPRKPSRETLEADNAELRTQNSALSTALQYLASGLPPDADERFKEPDGKGKHRYRLFGATRADGGTLVVTFRHPGQSDSSTAYQFDEHDKRVRELPFTPGSTLEKIAMERLRAKRNEIVAGEAHAVAAGG